MVAPITPKQADSARKSKIPNEVIEIFNRQIASAWDGRVATVKQDHVVTSVANQLRMSRNEVFEKGYLDIESIYGKAGWVVRYNKPGIGETFDAYFEFKKG